MKSMCTVLTAAGLLFLLAVAARAEPAPPSLPHDLEIELALSALPPHLRDGATVYTLGVAGTFETARPGTNGFHAFVSRIDPNAFHAVGPTPSTATTSWCRSRLTPPAHGLT